MKRTKLFSGGIDVGLNAQRLYRTIDFAVSVFALSSFKGFRDHSNMIFIISSKNTCNIICISHQSVDSPLIRMATIHVAAALLRFKTWCFPNLPTVFYLRRMLNAKAAISLREFSKTKQP